MHRRTEVRTVLFRLPCSALATVNDQRSRLSLLLPPALLAVALWVVAPFFGQLLEWLKETVGEGRGFLLLMGGSFVLAGVAILAAAIVQIWRSRRGASRWQGLALIALGAAMVILPVALSTRGRPSEAAVERMHFIFYGLLAMLLYRAFRVIIGGSRWSVAAATVAAAALVGVGDEWIQWWVALRTGDWFDLLLNAYGGLCGAVIALGVDTAGPTASRSAPSTAVLLIALVLASAGFVDCAHRGYRVQDEEIGSFKSFFTAERLLQLAAERAERWLTDPPGPDFRSLERQDHYWVEAGWHVRASNEARRDDVPWVAWNEYRIVEKYYAPMLDLRREDGTLMHRIHARTKGRLRQQVEGRIGERFDSRADPDRIWAVPRWQLWGGASLLCLLIALAARHRLRSR